MAQTGTYSADAFDVDAAYAQSFGSMPNKSVISSPTTGVDARETLNESYNSGLKAHTSQSGGAGPAGYAMIPIFVDPKIVDTTRKYTPVVELIPRVTNKGLFADYNTITAKGGAYARAEDAALSETNTTYDRTSVAIKFLYAVGRVTGQSKAGQPSYILAGMSPGSAATGPFSDQSAPNAKQQEVLVKAREMRELQENLIINGNATTSAVAGNPNGSEYDGFVTQLGTTNKVDKNNAALELADIDVAVQNAFDDGGRPNLGVACSAAFTDLLTLINAKIGFLQSQENVFWGFSTIVLNTMVGKIPVVPSMYLSNTAGAKTIYFLDLTVVEMRVLQDLTYEELAHTNDSDKFMLKVYEALIIRNPAFCSFIGEIA